MYAYVVLLKRLLYENRHGGIHYASPLFLFGVCWKINASICHFKRFSSWDLLKGAVWIALKSPIYSMSLVR